MKLEALEEAGEAHAVALPSAAAQVNQGGEKLEPRARSRVSFLPRLGLIHGETARRPPLLAAMTDGLIRFSQEGDANTLTAVIKSARKPNSSSRLCLLPSLALINQLCSGSLPS